MLSFLLYLSSGRVLIRGQEERGYLRITRAARKPHGLLGQLTENTNYPQSVASHAVEPSIWRLLHARIDTCCHLREDGPCASRGASYSVLDGRIGCGSGRDNSKRRAHSLIGTLNEPNTVGASPSFHLTGWLGSCLMMVEGLSLQDRHRLKRPQISEARCLEFTEHTQNIYFGDGPDERCQLPKIYKGF